MKKIILFTCLIVSAFANFKRTTPWLTEDSIKFLEGFLQEHPHAKILEFGSGASTIWFAKRTKHLYSVEHHEKWAAKVQELLAGDKKCYPVHYYFRERPYSDVCDLFEDDFFDLVVVDGRDRVECIAAAVSKVKPGGVLMLDNAERERYFEAFHLMDGWKSVITRQKKRDRYGFTYPRWQTRWWIKPVSATYTQSPDF